MTHMEFLCNQLQDIPVSKPIYQEDIAAKLATEFGLSQQDAEAVVYDIFKEIIRGKNIPMLRRYERKVYYKTANTPFGEVGINQGQLVADKYLLPDNGYETDYSELYCLGLSTWVPRNRCFASNNVSRIHVDENLGIQIRPPKTKITHENRTALQFLDVLAIMDKAPVDAEDPYYILANYAKKRKLKYEYLLYLAHEHYNRKVILKLSNVACALYETKPKK